MRDIDLLAVLVAAVAAFLLGGAFYAVLGHQLTTVSNAAASVEQPPAWQLVPVELGRAVLLSAVVAGLAAQGDIGTAIGGLLLGLVLWVGFPVVLWTGAMFHERVPPKLAAIHGGDWLVKLVGVGLVVGYLQ